MKNFGRIKTQKYIDTFTWNEIVFNKYLIKFEDDDEFYTIIRNEKIEQALIGGNIVYECDSENQITNHRILSFTRPIDYVITTTDKIRENLIEFAQNLKEKYDKARMAKS
jgi:hypothetical protein